MKNFLMWLVLLLPSLSVLAQDYLPRDVQRLIDLRAGCEASRESRRSCGATEKELVELKRKYAANSTIMQILNQFDLGTDPAGMAEIPEPVSAPKKSQPRKAGFSQNKTQANCRGTQLLAHADFFPIVVRDISPGIN